MIILHIQLQKEWALHSHILSFKLYFLSMGDKVLLWQRFYPSINMWFTSFAGTCSIQLTYSFTPGKTISMSLRAFLAWIGKMVPAIYLTYNTNWFNAFINYLNYKLAHINKIVYILLVIKFGVLTSQIDLPVRDGEVGRVIGIDVVW